MAHALVTMVCLGLLAAALPGEELRLPEMPNYSQRSAGMANSNMCGPTAMADVLGYLGKTGAISLSQDLSRESSVVDFIDLLGSAAYMHTDAVKGTSESGITSGVLKLFKELKVTVRLQTEGWYCMEQYRLRNYTEYGWIQDQLKDKASVLLSIGWYHLDAENKVYHRLSGHFVACAGFNDVSEEVLYINDPGSPDAVRSTRICTLQPVDGTFSLRAGNGARSMAGGCYILQGLATHAGNVGIIDYGLSLKVLP